MQSNDSRAECSRRLGFKDSKMDDLAYSLLEGLRVRYEVVGTLSAIEINITKEKRR